MFFLLAPGTVVGLVPWSVSGWRMVEPWPGGLRVLGAAVVAAGLVPLVAAFVRFARAGGTPAPIAPTDRLVVTGFHRYVRNPMYVGVALMIVGQALLFGQLGLLLYGLVVWTATAAFVRWYEEPTLAEQFGREYEVYRAAVPAWIPRRRPWTPE